jgi:hypothetical protein
MDRDQVDSEDAAGSATHFCLRVPIPTSDVNGHGYPFPGSMAESHDGQVNCHRTATQLCRTHRYWQHNTERERRAGHDSTGLGGPRWYGDCLNTDQEVGGSSPSGRAIDTCGAGVCFGDQLRQRSSVWMSATEVRVVRAPSHKFLQQRQCRDIESHYCSGPTGEHAMEGMIMTGRDKIHDAQEQVSGLQDQLDEVQRMLAKAEEIAAAGEAAKSRAQQLLGVSVVLVAVGLLLLLWGGRKKRAV